MEWSHFYLSASHRVTNIPSVTRTEVSWDSRLSVLNRDSPDQAEMAVLPRSYEASRKNAYLKHKVNQSD